MKQIVALAALICLGGSAAAFAHQTTATPATHVVTISDFAFNPNSMTIAVGDTVQFVNKDSVGHTATAKDGSFDSKDLETGKSWSYTFTKAGTYPYICSVHPSMQGTITAQ